MASEAQVRAVGNYDKKNTKIYSLKINKNTEKDIFDKLSEVDNVNGYIKELIRKDMKKRKKKPLT